MTPESITARFIEKDSKCNLHYLNRYIKLITISKTYLLSGDALEHHHVFPKAIYGYGKNNNHTIILPARWHYLAHWLLYKIFSKYAYREKCIYAFNMMSRSLEKRKGYLYEIKRKELAKYISNMNKGRVVTEEHKQAVSNAHKGMVTLKDKEGNHIRTNILDERYINGELVPLRVGYKHKKSTIQKMIDNSGVAGKVLCHNVETQKIKYFPPDNIPEGYVKGASIKRRRKNMLAVSGRKWYNNGVKNIRIRECDEIPDGFVKGRMRGPGFCGFDKINENYHKNGAHNTGKKGYRNIITGKIKYFSDEEEIPNEYIRS